MRQNLRNVIDAWMDGRQRNRARIGYNSIWTDGRSIYSYHVEILSVIQGCLYFNDRRYSRTTSTHQNALWSFIHMRPRIRGTSGLRRCVGVPRETADPNAREWWADLTTPRAQRQTTPAAPSTLGPIRAYHSSPRTRCLPSPFTRAYGNRKFGDGGRFFGVELEVERRANATASRGEIAQRIHDWVNNQAADITAEGHRDSLLQFENDGSLSDGFEMISAPMGLDDHAKLWKTLLSPSLVKELRSHDTTTCGLHVHVSRYGMTDLQVSKIVCFVNDPDNADLIRAVARRYTRGTREGVRGHGEWANTYAKKLSSAHRNTLGFKYQAVNLCNTHTIEFRIFRGSLNYMAVIAAVEFANAVADFCNPTGACGFNLKTPAFLDFINSVAMRKHTRHLRAYIGERFRRVPSLARPLPDRFIPANL